MERGKEDQVEKEVIYRDNFYLIYDTKVEKNQNNGQNIVKEEMRMEVFYERKQRWFESQCAGARISLNRYANRK